MSKWLLLIMGVFALLTGCTAISPAESALAVDGPTLVFLYTDP